MLQKLFQGSGQLIRAAGAAALAVNAFQHSDDVLDLSALAKPGQALGVAVAAFDNFHLADGVALRLEVDLGGTGDAAGGKGRAADAAVGGI